MRPGGTPGVVNTSSPRWSPPAQEVTSPDQLSPEAWRAVSLLDGEVIHRVWKTGRGFLVLTSLRCFLLWQRREVFRPVEWEASPEVLLFNVRPPRVLFGRFVEITPQSDEGGFPIRAGVAEPEEVAEEVAAAIPAARAAWEARRAKAEAELASQRRRREQILAAIRGGRPVPIPTVVCPFCGNPMLVTARACPHCGAPAGA
jgi:hypothetical protein